jgi:uncharacterized protein YbjQ (UPF0145 family)
MSEYAGPPPLPITTAFDFPGWRVVEVKGACFGLVVRSPGVGRGFLAGFQAMAGGEVGALTQTLEESRVHAMWRLAEHARALGGNAIIGMRFDSASMGEQLTEVVAYGTAVVVEGGG